MRFSFVGVICAALWVICASSVAPQQPSSYHRLSADEFMGKPDGTPGMVAYTSCYIDFHYRVTNDKRNNFNLTFDIRLLFNRDRSWIDRKRILSGNHLSEILNHEQGHYTIAYMEQQELIRTVSKTRFTANYQAEARVIFDRIDAKYQQLTDNYDTDTRNSLDKVQQHSWDEYFKKRLIYMPPAAI
jgi:hypothetical protein